jgi:hypothetical protein
MPHRAYHLALGIVGLLAVFALFLAGANLLRHCRTGSAWKQRLISAGLMLLGALGFGSGGLAGCKGADSPDKPKVSGRETTTRPEPKLAKLDHWKQINTVQTEAEAIAAGKKGRYPFNHSERQQLLGELKRAESQIDALQRSRGLNEGEAGLWKLDLRLLAGKVAEFRPTEMKNSTCYQPRALPNPTQISLARLRRRLPLLEKLALAEKLHPKVARKVLARIESDLNAIPKPPAVQDKEMAAKARDLVAKVKAKLGQATPR